jgi:hypothetical protein
MLTAFPVVEEVHVALEAVGALDVNEHQHLITREPETTPYDCTRDPEEHDPARHKLGTTAVEGVILDRLRMLANSPTTAASRDVAAVLRTAHFIGIPDKLLQDCYNGFATHVIWRGLRHTTFICSPCSPNTEIWSTKSMTYGRRGQQTLDAWIFYRATHRLSSGCYITLTIGAIFWQNCLPP